MIILVEIAGLCKRQYKNVAIFWVTKTRLRDYLGVFFFCQDNKNVIVNKVNARFRVLNTQAFDIL
jgi:hypothetical protein